MNPCHTHQDTNPREVLTALTAALSPQNIQIIYLLHLINLIKGRNTLLDYVRKGRKTFCFFKNRI